MKKKRKRKGRPDEELDDDAPSRINPLLPVSDDSGLTVEVAMDCEMVGVGQGNKSALGLVALVNRWGNVVYDEFVRPVERVVDFRTEISGIRPRDLRKAKDFRIVQKKSGGVDQREDIRDTLEYEPFMRGEVPEGHFGILQLSFLMSRSRKESTALLVI